MEVATTIRVKRKKYFKNFLDPIVYGVPLKIANKWHVVPVRKSKVKNLEILKDTLSPHWNKELIELGKKHQSQHLNGLK
jgi:hypothetical protein